MIKFYKSFPYLGGGAGGGGGRGGEESVASTLVFLQAMLCLA